MTAHRFPKENGLSVVRCQNEVGRLRLDAVQIKSVNVSAGFSELIQIFSKLIWTVVALKITGSVLNGT